LQTPMSNPDTSSRRNVPRVVRMLLLLLAIGAFTVVAPVSTPTPASADPQHGLRNTMFHQCLTTDFPGTHAIYMSPCSSGNPLQYWHHHRGNFAYRVMNYTSSICLDSNTAGQVYGNDCTPNNKFQEWTIRSNARGAQFVNVATGLCLDVYSNLEVHTQRCNTTDSQRWRTR
jgi:hypothetical protein